MKKLVLICSIIFSISFISLFVVGCSTQENPRPTNLTGTWQTKSTVPYYVQSSSSRPSGKEVENTKVSLLERFSKFKWDLNQRSDGLITGMHHWSSYDDQGTLLYSGEIALVGALNGNRIVLLEAGEEKPESPKVLFDGVVESPNAINFMAYDIGGTRPLVAHFVLSRVE